MGKYLIINDDDKELIRARSAALAVWNKNRAGDDSPVSTKNLYEMTTQNLIGPQGRDKLHDIIFDVLASGKDPSQTNYSTKFFIGLCKNFEELGITYASLNHCLKPQSKYLIEREIRNNTSIKKATGATISKT